MEKLHKLYYSPSGHQRGSAAAGKLQKKIPELTKQEIQHWLDRQPVYQIYKPKPKKIRFPHYTEERPNHTHQIDLLSLPKDGKYRYALTVIDIASRYKEGEPLKTKTATETSVAIQRIYDRSPLNFPKTIMSDKGREFMGEFLSLMKKNNVKMVRSLNKKKVAFVERFNKTLSEQLFAHQYVEEIKTKRPNREWASRLPAVVATINDEETRMIRMKPIDAIKLDNVSQQEYEKEDIPEELSMDSIVRYLYRPGEEHNDTRYRATDAIWSVDVYEIDEIRSFEKQPSLYTLQNLDEERTFTREQLQVVPPDTEGL